MRDGVPVAHVDLDGIGYGPPGFSGSFDLKFENVAAVWRSYSDAGASAFVVSGLRVLQDDVGACVAAVPGAVPTTVVLTVTAEDNGIGSSRGRTPDTGWSAAVARQRRLLRRSNRSSRQRVGN